MIVNWRGRPLTTCQTIVSLIARRIFD